jgi:adenylate cyclase
VFRTGPRADAPVWTRRVRQTPSGFAMQTRARLPKAPLLVPYGAATPTDIDPTEHPTFQAPATPSRQKRILWSDLHYAALDAELPRERRRIVLTVMRAVRDMEGRFLGVLRVALRTERLDEIARMQVEPDNPNDPHCIVLADAQGRLVTRLQPADRIVETEDDELRVQPVALPSDVSAALVELRRRVDAGLPLTPTVVDTEQGRLAMSWLPVGQRDWYAVVVVPAGHDTQGLVQLRNRAAVGLLVLVLLLTAGGAWLLRSLRRELGQIEASTARMRRFDFARRPVRARLREVFDVVEGLERAKTVARALGHYVPVDLVRQLFDANEEPVLGGELAEITLLFTDVADFTTFAERHPPAVVARALGLYFERLTEPVAATGGTVDKFIGDGMMAFWNRPQILSDHAERACDAALRCRRDIDELFRSPAWQGLPPLHTRFGLHTGRAMVGQFGSPARLAYTALGDDVNLASRLEGLGRQYGVAIVASGAVVAAVGDRFAFRHLDRVQVKGREGAVEVYQLLGRPGESLDRTEHVLVYKAARAAFMRREFLPAADLLAGQVDADPPSAALHARCVVALTQPPAPQWDGSRRLDEK